MPPPNKKTAPRTTNTSSKRLKNGPDARNNVVRWSDLNYNLISDIFSHLFTIQKLKYRRVSSAWNSMLLDHLSRTTVVSLQYSDLQHWKTIFYKPARETRLAMRARKVNLVTQRTRQLIIDFTSVTIGLDYHSSREIFGLSCNDEDALAAVCYYHPQIGHVVLWRIFENYRGAYSEKHLSVPRCLFGSMSVFSPNVRVTLCEFAFHCEPEACSMFYTAERTLIESWKMPWPNVTFRFVKENCDDVFRERSMGYWPYPPDQLIWLDSCLDMIPGGPERSHTLIFLEANKQHALRRWTDFARPTYLTLLGGTYPRFIVALLARIVVTFFQHLNLPPPPHPLIWND